MKKLPFIFGLSGCSLTEQEKSFFQANKVYGFILFARNVESATQLSDLTASLKELSNDENITIMIDQEGGRVARIKPPIAIREYESSQYFSDLIAEKGLKFAKKAVFQNYFEIGSELIKLGINTNAAPVADLLHADAHAVIGTRSFGANVDDVVALCSEAIAGLRAAGVQPILKHIPGHGRALCDSHENLPVVKTNIEELKKTDFAVFSKLSHLDCWSMTAHVKFDALDQEKCVTLSKPSIDFIRNDLNFRNNLIMTDDICMGALSASMTSRAQESLDAGCDIVLHCSGNFDEMQDLIDWYASYS